MDAGRTDGAAISGNELPATMVEDRRAIATLWLSLVGRVAGEENENIDITLTTDINKSKVWAKSTDLFTSCTARFIDPYWMTRDCPEDVGTYGIGPQGLSDYWLAKGQGVDSLMEAQAYYADY